MSVLIKGIKMPKDCSQCGACNEDGDGINYCGYDYDVRTVKLFTGQRPTWCPAVNVPTYGRLIDADKIRSDSPLITALTNLLKDCKLKHMEGCMAPNCEECIARYFGKQYAHLLPSVIEETYDSERQWIPVEYHQITEEERQENDYPADWVYYIDSPMPKEGQEILITTNTGYVEKDTCLYDGDSYYTDSCYDWCGDITAWMPLPEPYKKEGETNG